jgi:hypothetical protein
MALALNILPVALSSPDVVLPNIPVPEGAKVTDFSLELGSMKRLHGLCGHPEAGTLSFYAVLLLMVAKPADISTSGL